MAKKVIRHRSQLNTTIKKDLHEELRKISADTDVPISRLIDKAIEMLIREQKSMMPRDNNNRVVGTSELLSSSDEE